MYVVHLLATLAIAAALVRPQLRPRICKLLLLFAAAAGLFAILGASSRQTLELTHPFMAFVGSVAQQKEFVVGQTEAPGYLWSTLALAFYLGWALCLRKTGERELHPFLWPLALAWSGTAVLIGFEMSAAPEWLVRPFAYERALLPAGIAAAILLPARCEKLLLTMAWLTVFVSASRLLIAAVSTLATQGKWANTSLDVHTITHFANPLMQRPITTTPGSVEQMGWLIWGPELVVFPSLYMLSLGGIAFMVTMVRRHPNG